MLKKIAHFAMIVLLTVATTGFTISKLYCGNRLVAISIFKSIKCDCGDKDCHTNIKLIKVSDNYSTPEVIHCGVSTSFDLSVVSFIELVSYKHPALSFAFFFLKAPPFFKKNPLQLLQYFRI
jgi:hypothetical protein